MKKIMSEVNLKSIIKFTEHFNIKPYDTKDRLVVFLYTLMRNDVPSGAVYRILVDMGVHNGRSTFSLCNDYLAKDAERIASFLRGDEIAIDDADQKA